MDNDTPSTREAEASREPHAEPETEEEGRSSGSSDITPIQGFNTPQLKDEMQLNPRHVSTDVLARELREALFKEEMTQKDLAKELSVSQPTVSGWVNARKRPGSDNLRALIEYFGFRPQELVDPLEAGRPDDPTDYRKILMLPILATGDGEPKKNAMLDYFNSDTYNPLVHRVSGIDNLYIQEVYAVMEAFFGDTPIRKNQHRFTLDVADNAMEPWIPEGSRVVASLQSTFKEGIFAFFNGTSIQIRRVQLGLDERIRLLPLNSIYDTEILYPTHKNDWYQVKGSRRPVHLLCLGRVDVVLSRPHPVM